MSGADMRYLVIFDCGGVLVGGEILACNVQARAPDTGFPLGRNGVKVAQSVGMLPLALLGDTLPGSRRGSRPRGADRICRNASELMQLLSETAGAHPLGG